MLTEFVLVILNYNDYKLTISNIDNILSFYNNYIEFNIVVVDNNSPNNSFEELKQYYKVFTNIYIIQSKSNRGYAYGNNYGIKYITNIKPNIKYIGILNPDSVILHKNTFLRLINKLKNNDNIAGISPIMIEKNEINLRTIAWKIPTKTNLFIETTYVFSRIFKNSRFYSRIQVSETDDYVGLVEVVQGSFFIIKKEVFFEIGLFDENTFLYFEENIISSKIKKIGKTFAISFNDFYNHNHNHEETNFNLKNLIFKRKIMLKSKNYFLKYYCNANKLELVLMNIFHLFNVYIEIYLFLLFKYFIKRIGLNV